MIEKILKAKQIIGRLLEYYIVAVFVLIIILVTIGIISRFYPYGFLKEQMFSGELTGYLLVHLTFLGASFATYRNDHMSITYFVEKLSSGKQIVAQRVNDIVYFAAVITLFVISLNSTISSFELGTKADTFPLLIGFVYLAFPLTFILMAIFILFQMIIDFADKQHLSPLHKGKGCVE